MNAKEHDAGGMNSVQMVSVRRREREKDPTKAEIADKILIARVAGLHTQSVCPGSTKKTLARATHTPRFVCVGRLL